MWTIYDHPLDADPAMPYMARRWVVDAGGHRPGNTPGDVLAAASLDVLREQMMMMGLTCLTRSPGDDPVIVETWL